MEHRAHRVSECCVAKPNLTSELLQARRIIPFPRAADICVHKTLIYFLLFRWKWLTNWEFIFIVCEFCWFDLSILASSSALHICIWISSIKVVLVHIPEVEIVSPCNWSWTEARPMFWRSPPRPMSLSSGPSSPCSRVSTVSRCVPCSSYPGVSSHSLHIQLNLFCSGSPLEDEVNLAALENLTVDLTVPLLGGKVHGSLARAGKVRGQTPKVRLKEIFVAFIFCLFIICLFFKLAMMIYPCTTPTEMRRNLPLTFWWKC